MTGGLIQLVAQGSSDLFLTSDPQITFFKMVYRRHTNFSSEVIPIAFNAPNFGKRVSVTLGRSGDLIRNIHLVIELPRIEQFYSNEKLDKISKFSWIKRIGYGIIKTVEIEIGGELLDKHYGDWLNIWHEITVPDNKNIDKIIGDIDELTNPNNGIPSYKLYIPLKFWFNRITGLALPIVSLQYNDVKINLEINELEKCMIFTPTHTIAIDNDLVNFEPYEFIEQTVDGVKSIARFVYFDPITRLMYLWRLSSNRFSSLNLIEQKTEAEQNAILYETFPKENLNDPEADPGGLVNSKYLITGLTSGFQAMPRINTNEKIYRNTVLDFKSINLKNASLLVEYLYLDNEERIRFSQSKLEYLIEQVLYNGEKTIDSVNQTFKLGFTQTCKELIWITQLSDAQNTINNDIFNYTDSLIKDKNNKPIGNNIIQTQEIIFNGQDRVSKRNSSYFNQIQPYQHHYASPIEGINVYSFSLFPVKHQPSGSANFSKIDNISIKLNVNNNINFNNTAKLRVYCIINNILRISNGISGILFSNDMQN